jgi:endonuclease/exonuclease/phosphatase (EEP) superfamily protein YafD
MIWLIRRVVQLGMLALVGAQLGGMAQALHPFFDSLAHFRFHLAVLLALGVLISLALRSFRMAGAAVLVLGGSLLMMTPALGLNGPPRLLGAKPALTLVQYNTLYKNPTPDHILAQIRSANADAVTLEEVSDNTSVIMALLKADYPHQVYCPFAAVGGEAVLSRTPLLAQGCGEGIAWAQVEIGGRKMTIAGVHLYWPWPHDQFRQITRLEPTLRALPRPVIVGGDFNAASWSHSVARIADMTSTQPASGLRLSFMMGPGPTPFLPIDHVLLPEGASADVTLGPTAGSDHLPVIARIGFGD